MEEIKVKRIYNNKTYGWICDDDCYTNQGGLDLVNTSDGLVSLKNCSHSFRSKCETIGLYYYSGETTLTQTAIAAIIKLAHSKMPEEPCGCDVVMKLWRKDKEVPPVISSERAKCPFGINDGAWVAWKWVQSLRKFKVGSL